VEINVFCVVLLVKWNKL